jgi:Peptidase E
MENIILTSSGFNDVNNYVSDEMKNLLIKISKGKKVMILSNAAPKGTGNFVARENVKENFINGGADQVDIFDLNEENISSMLDYDVIYGLGGDPTYLIELNQNPNFKETMIKFLEKGIFVGESAGSLIMCEDLKWLYIIKKGSKKKYDVELDTYQGLGLTEHMVFPHWNKVSDSMKEKAENYENAFNTSLTKLNDGEFISIEYNKKPTILII